MAESVSANDSRCLFCFYPLSEEPSDGKYHNNCRVILEGIDVTCGTHHIKDKVISVAQGALTRSSPDGLPQTM